MKGTSQRVHEQQRRDARGAAHDRVEYYVGKSSSEVSDFSLTRLKNTCVYFTNLHLVSFLTINQQFGHEAEGNRSGQRQVMFVSGQAF
jgi:hypothetical protein